MCITFLYVNPGDSSIKYKLVLINNRDEFYGRLTQRATLFSHDSLQSIYGVDLAGVVKGTWLGISKKDENIRVGNLANVTGVDIHGKLGRGPIVTDFIHGDDETIESYNEKLHSHGQQYSSFNFLSVALNQSDDIKIFYVSNSPKVSQTLPPGYIGLGNSPLDAPFKKVKAGKENFQEVLERHKTSPKEELLDALIEVLKCTTKYFPDGELSSRRHASAESFSSIHVDLSSVNYGTRTRTLIIVDSDNNIDYVEETMTSEDPNGVWERTHLTIPKHSSQL